MNTDYITFLDESGDHNLIKIDKQFPVFTLSSVTFNREYYLDVTNPTMNELKIKYWEHSNIIFHSREIKKQINDFSILIDRNIRNDFQNDLTNLMRDLEYTIIAPTINKEKHIQRYFYPMCPYSLTLVFILERLCFLMKSLNGTTMLVAESRNPKENMALHKVYQDACKYGTGYVSSDDINKYIKYFTFVSKKSNENGTQIADLTAYPIARYALGRADNYRPFIAIYDKIYCGPNGEKYGLKIFPWCLKLFVWGKDIIQQEVFKQKVLTNLSRMLY